MDARTSQARALELQIEYIRKKKEERRKKDRERKRRQRTEKMFQQIHHNDELPELVNDYSDCNEYNEYNDEPEDEMLMNHQQTYYQPIIDSKISPMNVGQTDQGLLIELISLTKQVSTLFGIVTRF